MKVSRYRITLACVPFPFETQVVATTEEAAIKKAKYQASRCKLITGNVLGVAHEAWINLVDPRKAVTPCY